MIDMEFIIICLGIVLAPAIVPPVGVFVLELIECFVCGLLEVVEGVIELCTTTKEERAAREKAARDAEEAWYWYKIGHNSRRIK